MKGYHSLETLKSGMKSIYLVGPFGLYLRLKTTRDPSDTTSSDLSRENRKLVLQTSHTYSLSSTGTT